VKTALPNNIPHQPPQDCRALTILEMLVSTAMLAFIIVGLTAMFIQTQKAFKTGIKQTTVTDAGRTIIDMIASDLSQLSDPHFTNVSYPPTNFLTLGPSQRYVFSGPNPPNLYWSLTGMELVQAITNNGLPTSRVNEVEDIFAMVQTNNTWLGIGYAVSNWFTNSGGGPFPGVCTLYRYVATSNAPIFTTNLLCWGFTNAWNATNFHRVADGVVHLKIYAFDADGNEMSLEPAYDSYQSNLTYLQYPFIVNVTNPATLLPEFNIINGTKFYVLQTNYLPHSIDIELGILEPEAFEHARALYSAGAVAAAGQFLTNCAGQVEIFRQHVLIPTAP
jgi:type II secretory pathway pseudopilin PulG